ncbi:Thiamine transporter 2like [Caligus rogercresseyi]|uniref:Thiamine transporter 2like n=1 Tax=Caligus rogercresseyi TaxID=217165 RepID=A0A7T8QVE9_CALRO|nr:Thiamine transporter 2like [Caligus rogercresseyi]
MFTPFWTYSYLSILFVVFLITDFTRYRIIIILEGLPTSIDAVDAVPLWSCDIHGVAYFTYIYAKVDKSHYQVITSLTRVALLLGRFANGVLGQGLILLDATDYRGLNYISLGAFVSSQGQNSIYFHREGSTENDEPSKRGWKTVLSYFKMML